MADKRTPRPRAETPRGFRDEMGAAVLERQAMLGRIAEVYRAHGFEPLETPALETAEALGSFLPDVERPNAGVFALEDDGTWLALRYDLTAPLARVAAQHRRDLPTPYRRYAMGPVWRDEKPGPGRFRQFTQCDADTVGAPTVAADAEMAAMLAEALEAAGIARGDCLVRLGNRKVLDGVLEAIGRAPDARPAGARGASGGTVEGGAGSIDEAAAILRTIDKFDKVGEEGVRDLLTDGRRDESGAFIEGVGLPSDRVEPVIAFLTARAATPEATLRNLRDVVGASEVGRRGVEELEAVAALLDRLGLGADRAVVDPAVVRGLGYYTGPVLEAELTVEVRDDDGRPRRFGSVAGGGRYDDLVRRFTGQAVPATGVSIGVDRLLAALHASGRAEAAAPGPVVVTVMDRERVADSLEMAAELRAAGVRAEAYLGNPKTFGNQLKYADRRGSPAAVIQGSDEAARGVVQVKDLALGAAMAEGASLEEWRERPAQSEVPRAGMVAAVRAILAAPRGAA